jgi:hypothetical protein
MMPEQGAIPHSSGRQVWMLLLGFVFFPAPLFALLTFSFQSMPGAVPIVAAGTPIGILSYGKVSAFEPLASGVSRTVGASDYTISTTFGVRVTKILSASSSYTLQARLLGANGLTWQIDGTAMSTSPATVATQQPYSTTVPHTLAFVVPFSRAAGAVTTIFEVTAIAN